MLFKYRQLVIVSKVGLFTPFVNLSYIAEIWLALSEHLNPILFNLILLSRGKLANYYYDGHSWCIGNLEEPKQSNRVSCGMYSACCHSISED